MEVTVRQQLDLGRYLWCAWILWAFTAGAAGTALPSRGFDDRVSCERYVEDLQKKGQTTDLKGVCLPDTIDPREPRR